MRKIVSFFMVFIFFFVVMFSVKSNAKPTGAQMACSLALAGYMQKIDTIPANTTKDYYLLRNVNGAATQVFGNLSMLLMNLIGDQIRINFDANWNTLAYSIYKILKQDKRNALYLLFLTQPIKKNVLYRIARKKGWTIQNTDTMFISYITSKRVWNWKSIQTLGDVASVFTMDTAKNLKVSDNTDAKVITQTIYALSSKNPAKEIRRVYNKYIDRIYSYKTDPISYCGLLLGKKK